MKYIKDNWKFLVFAIIMCMIGGYFTTTYVINSFDQSIVQDAINQFGSMDVLIAISTAQITLYAVIFTIIGVIISNKVGLWKKFEANKKAIIGVIIISIAGGLIISVIDKYVFGSFLNVVYYSYATKPSIEYIISAFTYGGVYEEILLRLFLMTLLSWIIYKIFYRKEKEVPTHVFIIANIISALLFAAGHIPATIQTFGYIDGLILFRCFLLNGAAGLAFGWLYRKYGIGYAMLAHFGTHLVSKLIWILFI